MPVRESRRACPLFSDEVGAEHAVLGERAVGDHVVEHRHALAEFVIRDVAVNVSPSTWKIGACAPQ